MNAEAVAAPEHGIMSLFLSASQQKSRKSLSLSSRYRQRNLSINQFPNKEAKKNQISTFFFGVLK
jgi:hypothetical protein